MVKHIIPNSLKEALDYMDGHYTTIVAGGTDLMVQRRNWAELPPTFTSDPVYVFHLSELNYVNEDDKNVYIGAVTPMSVLLDHPATPQLLKDAIAIIAAPGLRNMATIAGNIGNASPAGDSLPILYALDALVRIQSKSQNSLLPIAQVIQGPRKTILDNNELITEIVIPKDPFTFQMFRKVGGRKADAISKVSFTGSVRIEGKHVTDLRIAFGAVAPTVVRVRDIEMEYEGKTVKQLQQQVKSLQEAYATYIRPIDDQRSNKEYRMNVAMNLLEQFISSLKEE